MPLIGCETADDGGTGGTAGGGGSAGGGGGGGSMGQVFLCSEQGIRDAIAEGGGPHTFECDGPHEQVVTRDEIVIDNDVILDGEGNLRVEGNLDHRVFSVTEGVTATLRGFIVTRGSPHEEDSGGGGIWNRGTLLLAESTVSDNLAEDDCFLGGGDGAGILNNGTLTLERSTVSGNTSACGAGGIRNDAYATLEIQASTISGNTAPNSGGIGNDEDGTVHIRDSTISGNTGDTVAGIGNEGTFTIANSIVDDDCEGAITSNGYNIESPGNTCGFDEAKGDKFDVTEGELNLGQLANNGGPTKTHEPKTIPVVSVAIDQIPEADCEVTTDQRGVDRPQGAACDIGAVEWRHCESAEDCDDNYSCTDDICDPASGICENNDWCI